MAKRIGLYIDHEPVMPGYTHAVERVLEGQGYEVMLLNQISREYPVSGLVPFQDNPVADIIVMDVSLTSKAIAWDLLSVWFLHDEIGQKPIIICSTDLLDDTIRAHLRKRGCTMIAKPFRPQDLTNALKDIDKPPEQKRKPELSW